VARVIKKDTNRYLIEVFLGRGPDGRRYHQEGFRGTLSQAKRYAAELEARLKPRLGPSRAAITVAEYLDMWLERIRDTVSERAWRTYRWHVERLKPAVGHLSLYALSAGALQEALAEHKLAGGFEGLSRRTLKGLYGTLRTALRQAVAWGYLPIDTTLGLKAPRVGRTDRRVLTREELEERLLPALAGYRHGLLVRLIAVTGMRLGEALGLKWCDLDLEKGVVTVRRAADCRTGELKDEPKTPAGVRRIVLDAETPRLLRAHREAQKGRKVAHIRREELVFASADGRPVREKAVRLTLKRALRKAGLPPIRVHDLRHGAATILLQSGIDLASVAAFLGHACPATTAAIYTHPQRSGCSVVADAVSREADREADR